MFTIFGITKKPEPYAMLIYRQNVSLLNLLYLRIPDRIYIL